jgi:hypothetical protein
MFDAAAGFPELLAASIEQSGRLPRLDGPCPAVVVCVGDGSA